METINALKQCGEKCVRIDIQDSQYPDRVKRIMKKRAPQRLYMLGNIELLNIPGIGFCGSRKANQKGLETAASCAEEIAGNNISVISGNAIGIDLAVHVSSLKSGGRTIFVLPEGINHFRIKKILAGFWDWNRVLVISQFEPEDSWQTFRAMTRNQLIIALSHAMVVIEASEKGGTISAGKETIRVGLPLFVAQYKNILEQAKGNQILLEMGAQKLAKSKSTNTANFSKIFKKIKEDKLMTSLTEQHSLL